MANGLGTLHIKGVGFLAFNEQLHCGISENIQWYTHTLD
jgi:hypothetical protein